MTDSIYSAEQVKAFKQGLVRLAEEPRTQFSKRQTVEELFEDIAVALEDHTYQEVALRLRERGFDISKGSLKQYFTRIRRQRKQSGDSKQRRQQRRRSSSTARRHQVKPDVKPDVNGHGQANRQGDRGVDRSSVNGDGERREGPRSVPQGRDEPEFAY
jgi:hypothetical protein